MAKRQHLPAGTVIRSRALRQQMGEPERRLWVALRQAFPSSRFRRQVPLGDYHADFCSHAARLIIEVDGDDHATKVAQDAVRTHFQQDEGYQVIRFGNADVMTNIDGVIAIIAAAVAGTQKGCR